MATKPIKPHYIKRNETTRLPQRLLFFDSETRAETSAPGVTSHRAFLIVTRFLTHNSHGAYTLREQCVFTSRDSFCDYVISLLRKRETLHVFAHNAEFDLLATGLFDYLLKRYPLTTMPVSSTSRFFWHLRIGDASLTILDTLNFWGVKLAELGQSVGLPKLEMPDESATLTAWCEYCQRDVEIIERAVLRLLDTLKQNDLGSFALTISGVSWNIYRHKFMPERKLLAHNRRFVTRLERDGYFGGRAEAWRVGSMVDTLHYVDVNSMYASVMRDLDTPICWKRTIRDATLTDLKKYASRYYVVAQVMVETGLPIVPMRHKERTIWPVGRFWTTLTSTEIELVRQYAKVTRVGLVLLYETARVFDAYIDYVWSQRFAAQEIGDGVMSLFWKTSANALYGKFAQYRYQQQAKEVNALFERLGSEVVYSPDERKRYEVFYFGKTVIWNERAEVHRDGMVAVSSAIAAAARVKLWGLMQRAGLENVYYVDTDALMVNDQGLERLQDEIGSGLGQLKVKWSSPGVWIHGAKEYTVNGEYVFRGISKTASWQSQQQATVEHMQHVRSAVRTGKVNALTMQTKQKHLAQWNSSRIVSADGSTRPVPLIVAPSLPAPALYEAYALPPSRRLGSK